MQELGRLRQILVAMSEQAEQTMLRQQMLRQAQAQQQQHLLQQHQQRQYGMRQQHEAGRLQTQLMQHRQIRPQQSHFQQLSSQQSQLQQLRFQQLLFQQLQSQQMQPYHMLLLRQQQQHQIQQQQLRQMQPRQQLLHHQHQRQPALHIRYPQQQPPQPQMPQQQPSPERPHISPIRQDAVPDPQCPSPARPLTPQSLQAAGRRSPLRQADGAELPEQTALAPDFKNLAPVMRSAPVLVYTNPEFVEKWAEFLVQHSFGPTAFVGSDGEPLDNQPSVNPSIAFWQRPIAFGDEPKSYIDIRRFLPIEVCIDMDIWWRLRGLEQGETVDTRSYNQLMMHFGLEYRLMGSFPSRE